MNITPLNNCCIKANVTPWLLGFKEKPVHVQISDFSQDWLQPNTTIMETSSPILRPIVGHVQKAKFVFWLYPFSLKLFSCLFVFVPFVFILWFWRPFSGLCLSWKQFLTGKVKESGDFGLKVSKVKRVKVLWF